MSVGKPTTAAVVSGATAAALEWSEVRALVAELAATDLGRERATGLEPAAGSDELARRRGRLAEAARLLPDGRLVPSFELPLGELLERLDTGRPPLAGGDLVRLGGLVAASERAVGRIGAAAAEEGCPELAALAEPLADLSALRREIETKLDRRGDVREDASSELVSLRRRIRSVRDELYRELGGFVAEHADSLGDETIPLRGGRLVVVLDSGARGRVPGLVHGRSGTGKSFYFEPLGVVERNNTLQQATEDEEAERRRILAELVRAARRALPDLARHAAFVGELDLLQAAHRFGELAAGRPADVAPAGELVLVAARHPLLDPRLAELRAAALGQPGHESEVVPLDLELSPESRALVVTGPNAGGKTVALKTAGLVALMAQSGLPVPAGAGTRLPVLAHLVATVGDEQDLLTDRSTFSGRLLRLDEAWHAAGPDSLVLLDELGSGTDPEEGAALGIALLEGLVERGTLAVVTTHLTQLAAAATETDGASCAAMEFSAATGEPTFRLLPGPPGASEALALARRLGLPAEWLDRAEARLGTGHRDLQRLLAEVEEVRRELAEARDRAAAEAADAEKLRRRLEEREAELAEERRTVGKRLRAELEEFRRATRERLAEEAERIRREVDERGRRKGLAAEATERLFESAPEVPEETVEPKAGPLVVGGTVRHRALGWEGTLEKLDRGRAQVSVRGKRVRCTADELTPAGGGDGSPETAPTPRRRRDARVSYDLAGTDGDGAPDVPAELHLLGRRVEPALTELDDYLDRALLSARPEVRVVHGHGTGRLRDAVREHLRTHPAVAAQRPGKRDEGGDGATVVTLREGG